MAEVSPSPGVLELTLWMDAGERVSISKFLSLVLRHRPDLVGLALDEAGWVDVDALLEGCAGRGKSITRAMLDEIVATSPKRRFAFSEDGKRIRASQGHSVDVALGYEATPPPPLLYHGTVARFLPAIRREGLTRMERHHVHLSPDPRSASKVGERRGKPVILVIRALEMAEAGHAFFVTPNEVWLTEHVPPQFIEFPG